MIIDTPAVLLTERVAYAIAPRLSRDLADALRGGQRVDSEVVDFVAEVQHLADGFVARRSQGRTSDVRANGAGGEMVSSEEDMALGQWVNTTVAARRLDCTKRNVQRLVKRESITGRYTPDGRLAIDVVSLESYAARRLERK